MLCMNCAKKLSRRHAAHIPTAPPPHTFCGRLSKTQAVEEPRPRQRPIPMQSPEMRSLGRPRLPTPDRKGNGLDRANLPYLLATAAWAFGHVKHHHKVRQAPDPFSLNPNSWTTACIWLIVSTRGQQALCRQLLPLALMMRLALAQGSTRWPHKKNFGQKLYLDVEALPPHRCGTRSAASSYSSPTSSSVWSPRTPSSSPAATRRQR